MVAWRPPRDLFRRGATGMEARIGEDGTTAPYLSAKTRSDKIAMIDRWLAEHPNDVMYLEVKRDDSISWRDRKKAPGWMPDFMRVGVAGEWAAAEHVRSGTADTPA